MTSVHLTQTNVEMEFLSVLELGKKSSFSKGLITDHRTSEEHACTGNNVDTDSLRNLVRKGSNNHISAVLSTGGRT